MMGKASLNQMVVLRQKRETPGTFRLGGNLDGVAAGGARYKSSRRSASVAVAASAGSRVAGKGGRCRSCRRAWSRRRSRW
jgi:hypothetical protein